MTYLIPGNAWHIGARKQQQDAFGFSNMDDTRFRAHGGLVAVVADGMGGMVDGQAASNIAKEIFLRSYQQKTSRETIPQALNRSLARANSEVARWATEQNQLGQTGTTLIAIAFTEIGYHLVSVGDSVAFLARSGRLLRLNRLHTRGNDLERRARAGEISLDAARQDPDRHALTSFVGIEPLEDCDATVRGHPIPARPGDQVLLCSDGLTGALTEPQIFDQIDGDPQGTADRLVQQAISRRLPNQDNITVLVIARQDGRS